MSRSNYDKPFYVDVGTSIVAIRCASNRDVVLEYDHARMPYAIELAESACDRMNKEAEIGRPRRNCDVGTPMEQVERQMNFCRNHPRCAECPCAGVVRYNKCELVWAQMPYEEAT